MSRFAKIALTAILAGIGSGVVTLANPGSCAQPYNRFFKPTPKGEAAIFDYRPEVLATKSNAALGALAGGTLAYLATRKKK